MDGISHVQYLQHSYLFTTNQKHPQNITLNIFTLILVFTCQQYEFRSMVLMKKLIILKCLHVFYNQIFSPCINKVHRIKLKYVSDFTQSWKVFVPKMWYFSHHLKIPMTTACPKSSSAMHMEETPPTGEGPLILPVEEIVFQNSEVIMWLRRNSWNTYKQILLALFPLIQNAQMLNTFYDYYVRSLYCFIEKF